MKKARIERAFFLFMTAVYFDYCTILMVELPESAT